MVIGLALELLVGLAEAQAPLPGRLTTPTFALIEQGIAQNSYTMLEQRRFRDDQGNVVSVREKLHVKANGSGFPDATLAFVEVVGELPGSVVNQRWQQTYARFGGLFVEHGSFRVRDLVKAEQNYTLHPFGSVVRAGRSAHRVVVFPNSLDKSIWLIDLDAATHVPLSALEFDAQFQLLAEVEAEIFVETPPVPTTGSTGTVASLSAAMAAPTVHADFAAASAYLGDPSGLIEPAANLANDYEVERVETRDDPLNGRKKLVITYTDGVDQFMVIQMPGTSDMWKSLGVGGAGGPKGVAPQTGNMIGRYRDPAMSVLVFWDQGVSFHVTGRGALHRLDELAKRLYLQALSTN